MDYTRAAEICERIAEVIGERGHTKNQYENRRGEVCLLGAGRRVAGWEFDYETGEYTRDDYSTHGVSVAKSLATFEQLMLTDTETAKALGFDRDGDVILWNDGQGGFTDDEGIEHDPVSGHDQEDVIDLAIERAKYWRNQPTVDADDSEVVDSEDLGEE